MKNFNSIEGHLVEEAAFGSISKIKEGKVVEPYLKEYVLNEMYNEFCYKHEGAKKDEKPTPSKNEFREMVIETKKLKEEFFERMIVLIAEKNKSYDPSERNKYYDSFILSRKRAFEVVEKSQPRWRTAFADDLYHLVANNLGLREMDENEDYKDLKFFTAIGSKLDIHYGIDGYFVYSFLDNKTKEKREIVFTIDLTISYNKFRSKSDLILLLSSENVESRGSWRGVVNKYGKEVAEGIKEKKRAGFFK